MTIFPKQLKIGVNLINKNIKSKIIFVIHSKNNSTIPSKPNENLSKYSTTELLAQIQYFVKIFIERMEFIMFVKPGRLK